MMMLPKERQEGDERNVIYKLLHYSIRFIIKVSILSSRFGRGKSGGLLADIPSDWVEIENTIHHRIFL